MAGLLDSLLNQIMPGPSQNPYGGLLSDEQYQQHRQQQMMQGLGRAGDFLMRASMGDSSGGRGQRGPGLLEQMKLAQYQQGQQDKRGQKAAQQALGSPGRYDPDKGILWNTAPPGTAHGPSGAQTRGLLEPEREGLLGQAYPEAYGKAKMAQLMPKPQDPYTLAPGAGRYGSDNQRTAYNPPKSDVLSTEAFKQKKELRTAGATNVTVGPQGQKLPSAPKGTTWKFNQDGSLYIDPETGGPEAIPFKGGGLYESRAAAVVGKEKKLVQKNIVVQDIDRIMELAEKGGPFGIGTTGAASYLDWIRGTDASDTAGLLQSVRASVGFDALNDMRSASKTGGALGQVSEMENKLLQAALGSLEQSLSKEHFLFNMRRVKDAYLNAIHGTGNWKYAPNGKKVIVGKNLGGKAPADMTNEELSKALQ